MNGIQFEDSTYTENKKKVEKGGHQEMGTEELAGTKSAVSKKE